MRERWVAVAIMAAAPALSSTFSRSVFPPAGRRNHGPPGNVLSVVTRLTARCPCLQTVRACLRPGLDLS
jgi:hypothetical protein